GYNPLITGARWLGKSETVLIIFEVREVPHFAFFKEVWLYNLYKNRVQVGKLCYQTGHQSDIRPHTASETLPRLWKRESQRGPPVHAQMSHRRGSTFLRLQTMTQDI
ncbi:unnamed protein product, partial [Ixodes pacificus]